MKRARPTFTEGEPAPAKVCPTLALGPFNSTLHVWQDFWVETVKYLHSKTLHQISCCSKALNQLVWNRLIPASENGLKFCPEHTKLDTFVNYLARVPRLKSLDFSQYSGAMAPVCSALTSITHLSNLVLPEKQAFILGSYWTQAVITHLTGLAGLTLPMALYPSAEMGDWLQKFKKLRRLSVEVTTEDPGTYHFLYLLTQLEKLEWRNCPTCDISGLKNLRELRIDAADETSSDVFNRPFSDFGLACLTNLTKLDLYPTYAPGITGLTNLEYLNMQVGPPGYLQELTRLTHLNFGEEDGDYHVKPENFRYLDTLTNLQTLGVSYGYLLIEEVVDMLCVLPRLSKMTVQWDYCDTTARDPSFVPCVLEGSVARLTQLAKLSIQRPCTRAYLLTTLTNLVDLELDLCSSPLRHDLCFIAPMTNLKTLRCGSREFRRWDDPPLLLPEELHSMTNLESLTIEKSQDTNALFVRGDWHVMTSLKKLFLFTVDVLAEGIKVFSEKITSMKNLEEFELERPRTRLGVDFLKPLLELKNYHVDTKWASGSLLRFTARPSQEGTSNC